MDILIGLLFAFIWASGPIAAKVGFKGSPPLTILDTRFVLAGIIMFTLNYGIRRSTPWPKRHEWKHLVVLALTNSVIYLGFSWLALREISAGVYNLFIATNPFLVAVFSSLWLGRKVTRQEWLGMLISAVGLIIATVPSLAASQITTGGLLLASGAVTTYAFGSVYFKRVKVGLSGLVLNGWQISIGALLLFPFAAAMNGPELPRISSNLVIGLSWSVLVISTFGLALWFYLLKKDPVRANMWMFLTPVFGYLQAALVLGEPIRATDLIGTVFVMAGLVVSGAIQLRWWAKTELPLVPAD